MLGLTDGMLLLTRGCGSVCGEHARISKEVGRHKRYKPSRRDRTACSAEWQVSLRRPRVSRQAAVVAYGCLGDAGHHWEQAVWTHRTQLRIPTEDRAVCHPSHRRSHAAPRPRPHLPGELYFCEPTVDAREAMCAQVQAATGAVLVPPYNHGPVIAGQGTIGLEFLEQVGAWVQGAVTLYLLRVSRTQVCKRAIAAERLLLCCQ